MEEIVSGIYEIRNTLDGHRYVGSAINMQRRWIKHVSDLNNNKHHSRHLQNAWNKYGATCFKFDILEYCFLPALVSREQFYMDTLIPEYNISPTAYSPLGIKRTEETRSKMSKAMKGNKNTLGYKHTDESIAKISAAKMGNDIGKDARARVTAFNKICMIGNKHLLGHKHSKETLIKMSISHKNVSNETRIKMSLAQLARWERYKKEKTGDGK